MAILNIRGYDVVLDDEDVARVLHYNWHLAGNSTSRKFFCEALQMPLHHFIMEHEKGSGQVRFSNGRYDYRKKQLYVAPAVNETISLSQNTATINISGHAVIVSTEDLPRIISAGPWSVVKDRRLISAGIYYFQHCTKIKGHPRLETLHRFILGASKGQIVDHISRNTLDNQRSNLRFCTSAQNNYNRHINKNNSSGRLGVCRAGKNSWAAYIGYRGTHYTKWFRTREEAVAQRERWEKKSDIAPFVGEVGQ